jgi:cytochrome P450
VAAERLELRGKTIEPGARVFLCLAAANRDPENFADPDRLDLSRAPNRQIGFGVGPHYCLGAPLARLEGQVSIPIVFRRLQGLRLADDAELRYAPTLLSRSLEALPVRFESRTPSPPGSARRRADSLGRR